VHPPRGEHRTAKGTARLGALTDTAMDMFLSEGYDAVSLDTLIAQVGGSRRNIYEHFGGKEGLFIEVVTRLCGELQQPLTALQIDRKAARLALREFGLKVLEVALRPRVLALHRLMIGEGQRFPALAQAIWHAGHDAATRTLSGWIERRQKTELRRDIPAPELAAQFINLVLTSPQLRALVGMLPRALKPAERSRIVDQAVDMFLEGARKS
jgi:AcrR family transcriptional regulator